MLRIGAIRALARLAGDTGEGSLNRTMLSSLLEQQLLHPDGELRAAALIAMEQAPQPPEPHVILSLLRHTESGVIARDSPGMYVFIAMASPFVAFAWMGAAFNFSLPIVAVLLLAAALLIWGFIRRPWRKRQVRHAECRRLLHLLERSIQSQHDLPLMNADTLRLLAAPSSGETRSNRDLARRLRRQLRENHPEALPIAAASASPETDGLPLPAATSTNSQTKL